MATSKSTLKRDRQNEKRRLRNKSELSKMKTQIKKLHAAVEEKSEDIDGVIKATVKTVDKTSSKGVIHKNKAARIKSRLTKKAAKQA